MAPVYGWYEPGAHGSHMDAPVEFENEPAEQFAHAVMLYPVAAVPIAQGAHDRSVRFAMEPGAHWNGADEPPAHA